MTFDVTITIYNSRYNAGTGFDEYFRTVVHNCSWYSRIKAAANSNGMVYDRLFEVRVLDGYSTSNKQYAAPVEYTDPANQYTLTPGTIILKGDGPPAPVNGNDLANLVANNDEAFKVMDYHDNRRIGLNHLYAEGK